MVGGGKPRDMASQAVVVKRGAKTSKQYAENLKIKNDLRYTKLRLRAAFADRVENKHTLWDATPRAAHSWSQGRLSKLISWCRHSPWLATITIPNAPSTTPS